MKTMAGLRAVTPANGTIILNDLNVRLEPSYSFGSADYGQDALSNGQDALPVGSDSVRIGAFGVRAFIATNRLSR